MFESKFGNQQTHGEMVNDIINIDELKQVIDTSCTYHFILVHSNNSHLMNISKNRLILTSVRNRSDFMENTEKYNEAITYGVKETKPMDEWVNTDNIVKKIIENGEIDTDPKS